jgi:hypothetical protein
VPGISWRAQIRRADYILNGGFIGQFLMDKVPEKYYLDQKKPKEIR